MNANRENFFGHKPEDIEKMKFGQGCVHELPLGRNWEKAMDAIHIILSRKWYYIGIATNTKKAFFNKILKKGMTFTRRQKDITEETSEILKVKFSTLEDLNVKIKDKIIRGGGDKDVWHFKEKWREFPKGTKVIVLYQQVLQSFFSSDPDFRRATLILDGRCAVADQNNAMLIIRKVFLEKGYSNRILKLKSPEVKQSVKLKKR